LRASSGGTALIGARTRQRWLGPQFLAPRLARHQPRRTRRRASSSTAARSRLQSRRGNRRTPSHDYACCTCYSRSWSELIKTFGIGLSETGGCRARSRPRAKTLKCMGNKNTGAEQAQKRCNGLNHRNNPSRPGTDTTPSRRAQSKGFHAGTEDPARVMLCHNSFAGTGTTLPCGGCPIRRATATIDSLPRRSPHFRRLPNAVSSYLDAEVGCIEAWDRRAPQAGAPPTEW